MRGDGDELGGEHDGNEPAVQGHLTALSDFLTRLVSAAEGQERAIA
jgi:hypothetical protein